VQPASSITRSALLRLIAHQVTSTGLAQYELGAVSPDGAADRIWPLGDQGPRPDELFAAGGVVYWSTSGVSSVYYCRVDSGAGCVVSVLPSGVLNSNANYGIVADSRNILAIIGSTNNTPPEPVLVVWPVPH
jgi:hypothetical protein